MSSSFESFLQAFVGALAKEDFYQGQSLPGYLHRSEEERGNDEADIVDNKVVSALLEALGYSRSEVKYNRAEGGRKRTDFTIQLPSHEYPKPCAVVESKNTATRNLEEHLPQLEGYLRARGAQRGILIDGKRLLAYELANPEPLITTDLPLTYLVDLWRGESLYAGGKTGQAAIPTTEEVKLRAFWQRFSRDSYTRARRLVEELTRTRDGKPHAPDGSTWRDGIAQLQIRKPDDAHFVREVRELIRDVRTDVEAQLTLRLEKYGEFKRKLEHLPGSTVNVSDEYQNNLKLLLGSLETVGIRSEDRNSIQFRLEGQRERFTERDLVSGLGKDILKLVNEKLRFNALRVPTSKDTSQAQPFFAGAVEAPKPRNGVRGQATLQESIAAVLERMQKLLSDYHASRERLLKDYRADIEVHDAFETWRDKVATLLLRGADEVRLRREFAAQTSYVLIVRVLLVRIAEDKGLLERIFTNGGLVAQGFDFVVANPPYVKADEGSEGLLDYRRKVKDEHPFADVRGVLAKKWDLFVPFVALGLHLLKDGGRMGMITSNAIEMVPYADRLRQHLAEKSQIDEVSYFPGARLFDDAQVENTLFFATKDKPDAAHEVLRRWHSGKPPAVVREEKRPQAELGEQVFRQAIAVAGSGETVPLEEICYVSKGMVLNSHEKEYRGLFKKEDLISPVKDQKHPVAYVEGKDIDCYEVAQLNYIEYGSGLRAPKMISRPTFPEIMTALSSLPSAVSQTRIGTFRKSLWI